MAGRCNTTALCECDQTGVGVGGQRATGVVDRDVLAAQAWNTRGWGPQRANRNRALIRLQGDVASLVQ